MKQLITTIAAVLLATSAFADPIHDAAWDGDLADVQAELDKGADVNAKDERGQTPVDYAERVNAFHSTERKKETIALLRKHGGKTGEELKAEGK